MSESRLPTSFMTPGTSSFADFITQAPDLLPSRRAVPAGNAGDLAPTAPRSSRPPSLAVS